MLYEYLQTRLLKEYEDADLMQRIQDMMLNAGHMPIEYKSLAPKYPHAETTLTGCRAE